MSIVAKRPLSFRVDADDLAAIDKQARAHKLTRSAYIVSAALGKLDRVGIEQRLDEHAQRLTELERRLDLAYG